LEVVRRELRVAFSRTHQPLPFRIAKWAAFLAVARRLRGTRWFWVWVLGLPFAGLAVHFFYRSKTYGWRRPWGGWQDLAAADPGREEI
jgi:hypothetical protein